MTVHYIPGIVREAFSLAFTDKNAIAGFTCTAIEDDRTIGTDGLPEPGPINQLNDHSSRPNNSELPALRAIQTEANQLLSAATSDPSPKSPQPGPSGLQATSTQLIPFSPEDIRPLPRAGPRSKTKRKYKKRKTAILTDTPEKNVIEEEYNQRNEAKKTIFQPLTGKDKRTLLTAKGKGKGKGKKTKNPPGSKGKGTSQKQAAIVLMTKITIVWFV
ncbi:hypothetical protein JTB14_022893 [Gonioctena quinquepunctata]|nr:hypothetical protein JTB14_022893 [Gonioctena quinquepunctata]